MSSSQTSELYFSLVFSAQMIGLFLFFVGWLVSFDNYLIIYIFVAEN